MDFRTFRQDINIRTRDRRRSSEAFSQVEERRSVTLSRETVSPVEVLALWAPSDCIVPVRHPPSAATRQEERPPRHLPSSARQKLCLPSRTRRTMSVPSRAMSDIRMPALWRRRARRSRREGWWTCRHFTTMCRGDERSNRRFSFHFSLSFLDTLLLDCMLSTTTTRFPLFLAIYPSLPTFSSPFLSSALTFCFVTTLSPTSSPVSLFLPPWTLP
jgi:hypothetical protein